MTAAELLGQSAEIVAALLSDEGADGDSIQAWLDASQDKIGSLAYVARRLAVEEAETAAMIRGLQARQGRAVAHREAVQALATALLLARQELGEEPKIKRPDFTAWVQASESVRVPDDALTLPPQFTRIAVSADKSAIKTALKAGVPVAGCEIVTTTGTRWRW